MFPADQKASPTGHGDGRDGPADPQRPPAAPRRPTARRLHGEEVDDAYAWMRQVEDPALADYLAAENAWTDARVAHLAGLREAITAELASVLPDEDVSAPWRRGPWEYRTRRRAGQQYVVHVRSPAGRRGAGRPRRERPRRRQGLPRARRGVGRMGDPRDPEHYAYLRSYSPYENLPGPRRPALLVTASRNDPRVSVHEPAKWVAAIRAEDAALPAGEGRDEPPLILSTLLGGGAHTGPAGRYDAWAHEALLHAVTLDRITG